MDTATDTKRCYGCTETKLRSEFAIARGRRDGLQTHCKACNRAYRQAKEAADPEGMREYRRRYRLANRERRRRADKAWEVRARYGLSLEDYDALLAEGCAICGARENLVCDHDHATGQVRAALCNLCNRGVGHFKDNPERLEAAAAYLRVHSTAR